MSVPRTDGAEPRLADAVFALPGWAHRVRADVLARDGRLQAKLGQGRRTRTLRGLDGSRRSWGKVARPRRPAAYGAVPERVPCGC